MNSQSMRIGDVRIDAYFQPYHDTRPLAPTRGELFTRPDTSQPTEQFFASLQPERHLEVLHWLLEVAAEINDESGRKSSVNIDAGLLDADRSRNAFVRMASSARCPVTFEFSALPEGWSSDEANHLISELRFMGHAAAFDNFGRSEDDFEVLREVQFDTVKVAGSVTAPLERSNESRETLERIHAVVTAAGLQHVVQGVESQAAYHWLQDLGFTTFQGYWFSIPAPAGSSTVRV